MKRLHAKELEAEKERVEEAKAIAAQLRTTNKVCAPAHHKRIHDGPLIAASLADPSRRDAQASVIGATAREAAQPRCGILVDRRIASAGERRQIAGPAESDQYGQLGNAREWSTGHYYAEWERSTQSRRGGSQSRGEFSMRAGEVATSDRRMPRSTCATSSSNSWRRRR